MNPLELIDTKSNNLERQTTGDNLDFPPYSYESLAGLIARVEARASPQGRGTEY